MTQALSMPSGDAEFFALAQKLGVDPITWVDPGNALICSTGRRRCRQCKAKSQCRLALGQPRAGWQAFAPFCPSIEPLFDLAQRGLPHVA